MGLMTRPRARITAEQRDALIEDLVAERDADARPLTLWERHERFADVERVASAIAATTRVSATGRTGGISSRTRS